MSQPYHKGTRYGTTKTVFVPGHWHCLARPVAGSFTGTLHAVSRYLVVVFMVTA